MNKHSRGRVLITGASSGIGAALAAKFAAENFDLILTARREGKLNELKEQLSSVNIMVLPMDLAEDGSADQLCLAVTEAGLSVDILVNNAGIFKNNSVETCTEAEWDNVIDTNLKGTYLM